MKAKRLLGEPLLHFLLIGAGLFLLFGWKGAPAAPLSGGNAPGASKIVVGREDIDRMTATFSRTWLRPPTELEVKGLVEDFVRSEIYYREALAIGLDRDDGVIRRRMRQKMEFILEDVTTQAEPTDEELRAFLDRHAGSYRLDPEIAFRHVYVDAGKRGENADSDARRILARLHSGADPETAGDPFLLASDFPLSPIREISKQFGEAFGKDLVGMKPDAWAGPVRSGLGLHLVFVVKRLDGRLPALEEARETVRRDFMAQRQAELKDAAYARLKERYDVVVEKGRAGQ